MGQKPGLAKRCNPQSGGSHMDLPRWHSDKKSKAMPLPSASGPGSAASASLKSPVEMPYR